MEVKILDNFQGVLDELRDAGFIFYLSGGHSELRKIKDEVKEFKNKIEKLRKEIVSKKLEEKKDYDELREQKLNRLCESIALIYTAISSLSQMANERIEKRV